MLRCIVKGVFLLIIAIAVISAFGHASSNCTRRCLAEKLMAKSYMSQPQADNCRQIIRVPMIRYKTLSVNTVTRRLYSRLQATMIWTDPQLGWDKSKYPYDAVVLPVNKIWTPELRVTNAVRTKVVHASRDLLVYSNGSVKHQVIINTEVACDINMFKYPFAADECPVAIQAWEENGCGMSLKLAHASQTSEEDNGEWMTTDTRLLYQGKETDEKSYIMVSLSTKASNPFITLILPSLLIILADIVSFALPLGGGERNSFKVTLVLSFVMFLIILKDQLPGDGQCSPVIRVHFCTCLIFLVLSMLVSMLLTRVSKDGSLFALPGSKTSIPEHMDQNQEAVDEESKPQIIEVTELNAPVKSGVLEKVVIFLEAQATRDRVSDQHQNIANKMDKICLCVYLCLFAIYSSCMLYMFTGYKECQSNHFEFWDDDDNTAPQRT